MKSTKLYCLLSGLLLALGMVSCRPQPATLAEDPQEPMPVLTRISYVFPTMATGTTAGGDSLQTATETPRFTFTPITSDASLPVPSFTPPRNTATATRTPALGVISTPTLTGTATLTKTPITPTATRETGWGGTWVVYYGADPENLAIGSMQVILDGDAMQAEATFGGLTINLNGAISADGKKASGTYTSEVNSGWFYWVQVNTVKFGGTTDNEKAFCAARQAENPPDPCLILSAY